MSRSLIKKTILMAATAVAIAIPTTASADTTATSTGYQNFQPGVYMQWSAVCRPALSVFNYPVLSHGDELAMPMAWLSALNVDPSPQIVTYTAYLLRWNGSSWVYVKDNSGNYVYQTVSGYVNQGVRYNAFSIQPALTLPAPGPGYYRVAISANWRSAATNASLQSLLYWAPITEANGSAATYCTFSS